MLVGGAAGVLHGASRKTEDADCVIRRGRDNLERVVAALRELNARLRVAGMTDDEARALPVQIDELTLEQLGISTWATDAGHLDIHVDLKDVHGASVPYEVLVTRAVHGRLDEEVPVRVAALSDVIAAKTFADRAKDREALPELIEIEAALARRRAAEQFTSPGAPDTESVPGIDL